jgi:hypothetical protein
MTRNGPYHTHKHVPLRTRAYPPPPKPSDIKIPSPSPPLPQPIPTTASAGLSSGFFSNVFQGFSFGLGSSVAHHTVSGIMNNKPNPDVHVITKTDTQHPSNHCLDLLNNYFQCDKTDRVQCDQLFEQYHQCIKQQIQ